MEPYLSKYRLKEYDNLLMQNSILKTKQKSLQLKASHSDEWWNLVQDLLQNDIQILFNELKADETNYRRKLKAYQ
jgi:hypothetical protein